MMQFETNHKGVFCIQNGKKIHLCLDELIIDISVYNDCKFWGPCDHQKLVYWWHHPSGKLVYSVISNSTFINKKALGNVISNLINKGLRLTSPASAKLLGLYLFYAQPEKIIAYVESESDPVPTQLNLEIAGRCKELIDQKSKELF